LNAKLGSANDRVRHYEQINSDLKAQFSVIEFKNSELQTAIEEKDTYIGRLLHENSFKKKQSPIQGGDDAFRKKIEDLRKEKLKNEKVVETYRKELEKVHEELEQYRHYVKDNSQGQVSLRKKTDLIRLESELRTKNKYIDTLLETIKDLKGRGNNTSLNRSNNSIVQRFSSKPDTKTILDMSKNSLNK
jgi:hypothetical protein